MTPDFETRVRVLDYVMSHGGKAERLTEQDLGRSEYPEGTVAWVQEAREFGVYVYFAALPDVPGYEVCDQYEGTRQYSDFINALMAFDRAVAR